MDEDKRYEQQHQIGDQVSVWRWVWNPQMRMYDEVKDTGVVKQVDVHPFTLVVYWLEFADDSWVPYSYAVTGNLNERR